MKIAGVGISGWCAGVALFAAVSLGGCASTSFTTALPSDGVRAARSSEAAILVVTHEAAAPAGLVAMCVREPSACSPASVSSDRRSSPGATSAIEERAASPDEVFRMLLAQRVSALSASEQTGRNGSAARLGANGADEQDRLDSSSGAASDQSLRVEVRLTEERFDELRRVNREVNRAIRPMTDLALYGETDRWTRPIAFAGVIVGGDCEDYALEKRARLLALGWPMEALRLVTVHAPGVGLHAVLVVNTDRGDFVLDNLQARPRPVNELDYAWLLGQRDSNLLAWGLASIAQREPPVRRDSARWTPFALAPIERSPIGRLPVDHLPIERLPIEGAISGGRNDGMGGASEGGLNIKLRAVAPLPKLTVARSRETKVSDDI
jgi:predicted transglutaminase-like cysteine proteinase